MKKRMRYCSLLTVITLIFCVGVTEAQTRNPQTSQGRTGVEDQSGLRFSGLLAQMGPSFGPLSQKRKTRAGQQESRITPSSLNLQVLGSGTIGRLMKLTAITGSNAIIGDSTIFEDKHGLVGIGTDSPSSRLTVAGTIETTAGGFKFPDGTLQTTAAASGLISIAHDSTLTGDGTNNFPLSIAVPFILQVSVSRIQISDAVIEATNTADGGTGIFSRGGASTSNFGGSAVDALGGAGDQFQGGTGVGATGGDSNSGAGGHGVVSFAGNNVNNGKGGDGVQAVGGLGSGAGKAGGNGVLAISGVGLSGATDGLAGKFLGDVEVSGNLSKGGGSFKIDHPLDPENKYLYHSFVESPDMMNIYNGNVTTDANGEAVVTLPDWFEALNRDFRYQLTVIGQFAQAIVAEKVKDNRFTIRTSAPGVEVSWQVTGIRHDAYANAHRIPVEEVKPEAERGTYLHPDAFGQPEERGVEWVRDPEMMQQLQEKRTRQLEESKRRKSGFKSVILYLLLSRPRCCIEAGLVFQSRRGFGGAFPLCPNSGGAGSLLMPPRREPSADLIFPSPESALRRADFCFNSSKFKAPGSEGFAEVRGSCIAWSRLLTGSVYNRAAGESSDQTEGKIRGIEET